MAIPFHFPKVFHHTVHLKRHNNSHNHHHDHICTESHNDNVVPKPVIDPSVPSILFLHTEKRHPQSTNHHVSFDEVATIRSYPSVLGDNPSVGKGPPVAIGWEYTTEQTRVHDDNKNKASSEADLYLTKSARTQRLLANGVTHHEMLVAETEAKRIQHSRMRSNSVLQLHHHQ